MPKLIDLTGQKFGRLIVIKQVDNDKHGNSYWSCLCDCGKKKIISGSHLRSGHTKSCGCLKVEKTIQRSTKHGHNKKGKVSRTYKTWLGMIQRCNNPNVKHYNNYGGRGIVICDRWKNSFENFLEDMGEAPVGHQIDRIDNDQGYFKENCRWATRKEQNRNRRDNHLITFNGKTQCIADWAEETGIAEGNILYRLKHNWSIEKTLTTHSKKRGKTNGRNRDK